MAVISSEMYEALLAADVPEDKARAAAAEVARGHDLVSKTDLFEFGVQLRADMDKRFGGIDKRFASIDKRFASIDKRLAGMDKRFGGIDKRFADIEASLAVLKFAVYSGGAVVLALLIKLTFFP